MHALAAFLATFLTLCHTCYSNSYIVEKLAGIATLAGLIPDAVLYFIVKSEMRSVGESVITNIGPGSSILLFARLHSFLLLYLTAFSLIMAATICLFGGALLRSLYAKRTPAKGGGGGKSGKVTYITGSALSGLGGGGGGGGFGGGNVHYWEDEANREVQPGVLADIPGKTLTPGNFGGGRWQWNPGEFEIEDLYTGRPHQHWWPVDTNTLSPVLMDVPSSRITRGGALVGNAIYDKRSLNRM